MLYFEFRRIIACTNVYSCFLLQVDTASEFEFIIKRAKGLVVCANVSELLHGLSSAQLEWLTISTGDQSWSHMVPTLPNYGWKVRW